MWIQTCGTWGRMIKKKMTILRTCLAKHANVCEALCSLNIMKEYCFSISCELKDIRKLGLSTSW